MVFMLILLILLFALSVYYLIIRDGYKTDDPDYDTEIDFFDDIIKVLDKYHIEYDTELDAKGNKMLVVIRKDSDPFFAITNNEK